MLPSLTPPRTRWTGALVGASIGLLAALAYRVADFPGGLGGHADAFVATGAVCGALIGFFAWTPIVMVATVAIAGLAALIIWTPVLSGPVHRWIRRDSLANGNVPLDAVVVLSSSVNSDGVLDDAGTERLISGLELAKRTRPRLLVTTRVVDRRPIDSDADQRALIRLGGDTAAWRVVAPAHTTHDEALRTAELMAPAASHTIAVVTSPMHSRRACATFEAVGFHVICAPSESRRFAIYSLGGPVARVRALSEYLYERLAVVEYRARGWLK